MTTQADRPATADADLEKYTATKGLFLTDRDSLRKFVSDGDLGSDLVPEAAKHSKCG